MNQQRNDMKSGVMLFFTALSAFLCSFSAFCLDLEKDFRREIALYHVRPDQAHSLKRDSNGTPVSETQLESSVRFFYENLYLLDPGYLKRFKVREVAFKDTVLDPDGGQHQHRLLDGCLFLDADLDDKQFFVNVFYLQLPVMPRTYLTRWNKLNPDGFSYEYTRGTPAGQAQKKLAAVLAEWDKYFVSQTGLYSTEMDMALTFAYMVSKGPDAMAFVKKNSPTVQKKFEVICDILESVKAFEPGFMQTLLAEDLSTLKIYSPRALSVRLYQEIAGEWSDSRPVEEAVDDPQKIEEREKNRINEPVEVAGRKVIPLILSLEVNDFRLFSLLMANKADPNVVNGKKMSALMLAISNNDPDEVKLLLEAGANVTPEVTRAGTAAGVNAEIVKLLKQYLPGVKKSDAPAPEKKPAGKAAGDAKAKTSESAVDDLTKRLNETMIDHVDFEEVPLKNVVQFLRRKVRDQNPGGGGIQIGLSSKYADTIVSFASDNVSLYDVLQLICYETGLEVRLEAPDKAILSAPKSGQADAGNKNTPAKKKP